ncbi:MAG TPA: LysM peptidoglycan-binding domain-containing protein, partial [Armatimonadota bacterium]
MTKPTPLLLLLVFAALLVGCVRPWPGSDAYLPSRGGGGDPSQVFLAPTLAALPTATQAPGGIALPAATPIQAAQPEQPKAPASTAIPEPLAFSPTPDAPHVLPTLRTEVETYTIQGGDTLAKIAQRYQVSLQALLAVNPSANPDLVYAGTVLTIPTPSPDDDASSFKIIPDSELVYGPRAADFDTSGFIKQRGGLLASYHETVDDVDTSGPQIVDRIAHEYSVNPRLLLAVLEYTSHWVTESNPTYTPHDYPMGYVDSGHVGLFRQLSWTANVLNYGFYLWRANGLSILAMPSGDVVPLSPTVNAGTVGVQYLYASLTNKANWQNAVSQQGVYQTFTGLFGSPFDYAFEPLFPADLAQPAMQLPFEEGDAWSFTGGPHGGWASGSGYAAVDFAPPGDSFGCFASAAWEVAIADGVIVRSGG